MLFFSHRPFPTVSWLCVSLGLHRILARVNPRRSPTIAYEATPGSHGTGTIGRRAPTRDIHSMNKLVDVLGASLLRSMSIVKHSMYDIQ